MFFHTLVHDNLRTIHSLELVFLLMMLRVDTAMSSIMMISPNRSRLWLLLNFTEMWSSSSSAPTRKASIRIPHIDCTADLDSGYIKSYIVSPPTIWGRPQNKVSKSGLTNTLSIQIPALVKVSLARGIGSYVGAGKNVWDNVHIDDGASLIRPLLPFV